MPICHLTNIIKASVDRFEQGKDLLTYWLGVLQRNGDARLFYFLNPYSSSSKMQYKMKAQDPIYKKGQRYDFAQLSTAQKEKVLKLTAEFLTETDLAEFTDFVIQYAWKSAEDGEPCETPPFCLQRHLNYFYKQLHEL